MKFRKKPVIIDAVQWDGSEPAPDGVLFRYFTPHDEQLVYSESAPLCPHTAVIRTLEGDMKVSRGDWVITGVNGEKYPCKPDIFEKTYEPVDNG